MRLLDNEEPIFLPRGSVRAIIVLLITLLFVVTTIINKEPDLIVGLILSLVLVMYFASRYIEGKIRPQEPKLAEELKLNLNN